MQRRGPGRPSGRKYGQKKTFLFSDADEAGLRLLSAKRGEGESQTVRDLIAEECARAGITAEEIAAEAASLSE